MDRGSMPIDNTSNIGYGAPVVQRGAVIWRTVGGVTRCVFGRSTEARRSVVKPVEQAERARASAVPILVFPSLERNGPGRGAD